MAYDEPYRPQFHFTPVENWLNDPNGLVYYAGEYHLFYQYHPDSTSWGPMHWGHAVSADLVHWTHLPIALHPDEIGAIFSGSAVIDWRNTAGFGVEAMVAIFTHDTPDRQVQSLAYSTDRGRSWRKYAGNPVLEHPENLKDFRDPKVFWCDADEGPGHWVQLLAADDAILIYTSSDLKAWRQTGGFGFGYGETDGVWETPELFELPVDGGTERRWVLSVGVGAGAPAGGSGNQYFIGDFDGATFISDNPQETVLWADYGADFYAAQSWTDAPDGRRIWLAWMNNWVYARDIPTSAWRGAMTIPRDLGLTKTAVGIRLTQCPVAELAQLRGKRERWEEVFITPSAGLTIATDDALFEIIAEFQLATETDADRFGVRLHTGDGEFTAIGYAAKESILFVDRTRAGNGSFNPEFSGIHTAEMMPHEGGIRLHLFVDRSSVEVFGNQGETVITDQIFPTDGQRQIEIFADGGVVILNSLSFYPLKSARFDLVDPNDEIGAGR